MFEIFTGNLVACIGPLVEEAARHGVSYFSHALRPLVCQALAAESASEQYTVLKPDPAKPVIEDMDLLKVPLGTGDYPLLSLVGNALAALVQPHVNQLCGQQWLPNEAAVHRYHAGSQGLGAHRDFKSDELMVAVFTIHGCGRFELLKSDHSVLQHWDCAMGGLCIMRAPGLTGRNHDDRPLHRALAPAKGYRQSIIYRHINA